MPESLRLSLDKRHAGELSEAFVEVSFGTCPAILNGVLDRDAQSGPVATSIKQTEQDAAWLVVDLHNAMQQRGDTISDFDLGAGQSACPGILSGFYDQMRIVCTEFDCARDGCSQHCRAEFMGVFGQPVFAVAREIAPRLRQKIVEWKRRGPRSAETSERNFDERAVGFEFRFFAAGEELGSIPGDVRARR